MTAPPVDSGLLKTCCAELWSHPAVQLLVGEALRPGGAQLTAQLVDSIEAPPGGPVLDVGCGPGTTLELLAVRGYQAYGVDLSPALAREASRRAPTVVGDAERLPYGSAAFDAAVMECVLSAVPDKATALDEVARVLKPEGRLALSDVTLSGTLPQPLDSLAGWVACAAGALTTEEYVRALSAAGFHVSEPMDQQEALAALLAKARRRLALMHGAAKTGLLAGLPMPAGVAALADLLCSMAIEAVESGVLGYVALVARRS